MAKKRIEFMDTSFRDGFQSVFGARVATIDFLPALEEAKKVASSGKFKLTGKEKKNAEDMLLSLLIELQFEQLSQGSNES